MKKRITGLLLAVVILVSILPAGAITVSAASALNTSDECIKILKAEEGFVKYPYWDYAQYSIGYGTRCPDDKLDYYSKNGITEAEAEALLRVYLDAFEEDVNVDLIDKFGLTLTQNQFDALIMFSYNCGTGWIYNDKDNLRKAIINGATGNELIDRFSRWCNAGGEIKTFLLKRRLCEANMYLNGVYSRTVPENFGYVLYDANGGTTSPNVQGYNTELTASIIPVPTYEGYNFVGWFTSKVGGTQVTILDASVRNTRIYAHWVDAEGNDPNKDDGVGILTTVMYDDVNLREGPSTSHKVIGTANKGDQFRITETATGSGYTWGKYSGGWICLDLTNYDTVKDNPPEASKPETPDQDQEATTKPTTKPTEPTTKPTTKPTTPEKDEIPQPDGPVKGTVKVSDCLRVRSGPGTGYSVTGYLYNGNKVTILEQKTVGHMEWGKIDKGWISMDYVKLDATQPETKPTTKPETTPTTKPETQTPTQWTGVVKVSDCLRVRSGAGTSNQITGYYYPNDKVTITEKKTVGSTVWGKTAKGWISLDYVTITGSSGGSSSTGSTGSTGSTTTKQMGTVNVNEFLRIRTGAGTTYSIAGYLKPKDRVEILEKKTVGGTVWGRIDKGWISLDYVILDKTTSGSTGSQTTQTVTKTVTADCLRVRKAAGTSNSIVGYLYKGAKVQILETTKVGNTTWGRVSNGWISMDYVK